MGNGDAEFPDAELVRRAKAGDHAAYAAIVRRYQGTIRATAARFLDSPDDVDDLAQDCFVHAYEKLGSFRGDGSLEGWLRRIAIRLCYDRLRVARRARVVTSAPDDEGLARVAAGPIESNDHAEDVAMRDLINRLMEKLAPADRLILQLQVVEGYSVKEIAAMTGWSPVLVRVRASRARRRASSLVEQLEEVAPPREGISR